MQRISRYIPRFAVMAATALALPGDNWQPNHSRPIALHVSLPGTGPRGEVPNPEELKFGEKFTYSVAPATVLSEQDLKLEDAWREHFGVARINLLCDLEPDSRKRLESKLLLYVDKLERGCDEEYESAREEVLRVFALEYARIVLEKENTAEARETLKAAEEAKNSEEVDKITEPLLREIARRKRAEHLQARPPRVLPTVR